MRDEIELTRRAIRWCREAPPQDVGACTSPSPRGSEENERADESETRRRSEDAHTAIDGRRVRKPTRSQPIVRALLERHAKRARHGRHRLPGVRARSPRAVAAPGSPRPRSGGARESGAAHDGERSQARGQHVEKIVETRGGPAELLE